MTPQEKAIQEMKTNLRTVAQTQKETLALLRSAYSLAKWMIALPIIFAVLAAVVRVTL